MAGRARAPSPGGGGGSAPTFGRSAGSALNYRHVRSAADATAGRIGAETHQTRQAAVPAAVPNEKAAPTAARLPDKTFIAYESLNHTRVGRLVISTAPRRRDRTDRKAKSAGDTSVHSGEPAGSIGTVVRLKEFTAVTLVHFALETSGQTRASCLSQRRSALYTIEISDRTSIKVTQQRLPGIVERTTPAKPSTDKAKLSTLYLRAVIIVQKRASIF